MKKTIKLRQAQVWKLGGEYFRIVHLERLEVEYKSTTTLTAKKGTHHKVAKKDFCRLLKNAALLTPAETLVAPTSQASIFPSPGRACGVNLEIATR